MLCVLTLSRAVDVTMTYRVPAGSRDCFYQEISAEGEIDLEYQVHYNVFLNCICNVLCAGLLGYKFQVRTRPSATFVS